MRQAALPRVQRGDRLEALAARVRPVTGAESRLMAVPPPLAGLLPEGGIRRGSTLTVEPVSAALALAGAVTGAGGWVVAVGFPSLGLVAAAEMGVDLARLALVPHPGGQWPAVVAALADGFEMIVVRPPAQGVRSRDARRLAARVRQREAVMLVVGEGWPESPDLRISARAGAWEGLGAGHGRLVARRLELVVSGRRLGGGQRCREVWLPGPSGGLEEGGLGVEVQLKRRLPSGRGAPAAPVSGTGPLRPARVASGGGR